MAGCSTTNRTPSPSQVSHVERRDPFPPVVGGGNAVRRSVGGEERMASVVVAVELVRLVLLVEDLVELGYLRGARIVVLVAEQAEQGARSFGSWSTMLVTWNENMPSGRVPTMNSP